MGRMPMHMRPPVALISARNSATSSFPCGGFLPLNLYLLPCEASLIGTPTAAGAEDLAVKQQTGSPGYYTEIWSTVPVALSVGAPTVGIPAAASVLRPYPKARYRFSSQLQTLSLNFKSSSLATGFGLAMACG